MAQPEFEITSPFKLSTEVKLPTILAIAYILYEVCGSNVKISVLNGILAIVIGLGCASVVHKPFL